VILIAGGSSKGADFEPLGIAIAATAAALVTIGEEGPAIARAARAAGFTGPIDEDCVSMARAVAAAVAKAQAGDVVLLSPACASFGMFASYAERGDAFRQAALNR
jgi:UDP-N-acetylmuramoylalanine--D-glutamate ligase